MQEQSMAFKGNIKFPLRIYGERFSGALSVVKTLSVGHKADSACAALIDPLYALSVVHCFVGRPISLSVSSVLVRGSVRVARMIWWDLTTFNFLDEESYPQLGGKTGSNDKFVLLKLENEFSKSPVGVESPPPLPCDVSVALDNIGSSETLSARLDATTCKNGLVQMYERTPSEGYPAASGTPTVYVHGDGTERVVGIQVTAGAYRNRPPPNKAQFLPITEDVLRWISHAQSLP
jgi:hypothetical protein